MQDIQEFVLGVLDLLKGNLKLARNSVEKVLELPEVIRGREVSGDADGSGRTHSKYSSFSLGSRGKMFPYREGKQ